MYPSPRGLFSFRARKLSDQLMLAVTGPFASSSSSSSSSTSIERPSVLICCERLMSVFRYSVSFFVMGWGMRQLLPSFFVLMIVVMTRGSRFLSIFGFSCWLFTLLRSTALFRLTICYIDARRRLLSLLENYFRLSFVLVFLICILSDLGWACCLKSLSSKVIIFFWSSTLVVVLQVSNEVTTGWATLLRIYGLHRP